MPTSCFFLSVDSADLSVLNGEMDSIKFWWIPPFVSGFRVQFNVFVNGFHCLSVDSATNFSFCSGIKFSKRAISKN